MPAAAAVMPRVTDVRAWWRVHHPPPAVAQRLDVVYTAAVLIGVYGVLAYGTARSALGPVVSPRGLGVFGPSAALLALLLVAQSGAHQGPVVFSVPDVVHLLGAPLSRRALAARRLIGALAAGGLAGAVAAAPVVVGLAGDGRGIAVDRAVGVVVGLTELGVLATSAAWAVQRSARCETVARRAWWPAVVIAAGLVAWADAGRVGRSVALWSGPWGWAVQPGSGGGQAAWLAALSLLTGATVAAAIAAVRDCGNCPTERHLLRAEARTSAVASLTSFDARTARRALAAVGERPSRRATAELGRLRAAVAARGAGALAVVWRDAVAAAIAPGRVAQAAALAGAGTVLGLAEADRPLGVATAMLLVYAGAARLLGPLRAELDDWSRPRVLLRPRLGRVLLAHTALAIAVAVAASAVAAAGCAIAGALPDHGAGVALAAVAVVPAVSLCAALSARRGGRMPQPLLFAAIAGDPSGGGVTVLLWAAFWPVTAAVAGAVPIVSVSNAGAGAAIIAAAWIAATGALLARLLDRDPVDA